MKYYINGERVSEEIFFERLEEETRAYVEENYDDILDDYYNEITIGSLSYPASEVLRHCDPIAYNCGINDEVDFRLSDNKYDIEHYQVVTVNGFDFTTEDEDEDEEDE